MVRDGVSIFQDDAAATSYAVNPLAGGGAQFLVAIGGPDAPEEHAFPIDAPASAQLTLTEDGGAQVAGADGSTLATIPAPWAKDANDRAIPTHFTIVDDALVQVVKHVGSGAAYPVLADPSIELCNWFTAVCITFSKSEVLSISTHWATGVAAGITAACSKIPWSPWYVAAIKTTCIITLAARSAEFIAAIRSAKASGKCVEAKWSIVATPFLSGSKVVGC